MSVTLHPKHGLNPTLTVCAFCGEDTGEIVLLGAAYKGEAPHRMCIDTMTPCKACKANMAMGIAFIEVETQNKGWAPRRWTVITREAAERILVIAPTALRNAIMEKGMALMEPKEYEKVFGTV